MKTRLLGHTNVHVGTIGFGAWQLNNPLWGGPDQSASIRLVHAALAAGVNFFDTAPGYGEGASETALGLALRGRRDSAVICTKFGHTAVPEEDFAPTALRPALEESLRRMQTDYVDLLLLHNPPSDRLSGAQAAELYSTLTALQQEGKLRWFGASIDSCAELQTVAQTTPCRVAELLFNAFHQGPAAAFADAAQRGIGLIAKVPLDSGWLSGKYDATSRFVGIRERWTPSVIARRARLVEQLRELLPEGLSLPQAALGFVLAHPEIATVIPGTKSLAQLEANLTAAHMPLPSELVAQIKTLWESEIALDPLPW